MKCYVIQYNYKCTKLLYMYMKKIDCTLQFKNNHIIVLTIRQYDKNSKIKILASKNDSSHTYKLLDRLIIVPETNKVTGNI